MEQIFNKFHKLIKSSIAVIIFSIITTHISEAQPFGGGTGAYNNPFQIKTVEHLYELTEMLLEREASWSYGKRFLLMNDITDSLRLMIGDDGLRTSDGGQFYGWFDGNNKKITMAITIPPVMDYHPVLNCGLFVSTGSGARITNLSVDGYIANFNNSLVVDGDAGYSDNGIGVGGFVGYAFETEFINCVNYAVFPGYWECVGGIVRRSGRSKFINCMNSKNLSSIRLAGGIVGYACIVTQLSHCINIGSIRSLDAGGMVGGFMVVADASNNIAKFSVINCINAGYIRGRANAGGMTGANRWHGATGTGDIINCLNTGVIECDARVGAISSFHYNLALKNNHYDKQMCIYGGVSAINDIKGATSGYLTNDMIGDKLREMLGDEDWVYRDNLYPTLKIHAHHHIAMIARSPAYLEDIDTLNFDRYNNIRTCFTVNIENNVEWTNEFTTVDILPFDNIVDEVFLLRAGTDTLFAGIRTEHKTVPIRISNIDSCFYTLELTSNPPEAAAALKGAGKYKRHTDAEYEVVPNDCWRFIGWTNYYGAIGLPPLHSELIGSQEMKEDYHFVANFVRDTFELITISHPEEGGIVEGTDLYDVCSTAIYTAIPNDCYRFLNWIDSATGEIISTNPIDTIDMKEDYTLIANFILRDIFDLEVQANPFEGGIVGKELGCETSIYTAVPNDCYRFINWIDSATGEIISTKQIDTIEMERDYTLIANFEYLEFELELRVFPPGSGVVTGDGIYLCREYAIHEAVANDCYTFLYWRDAYSGDTVSWDNIDNIFMEQDRRLTAIFERNAEYTLTTQASPIEGGTTSEVYFGCSTVVYTAISNDCYRFINWTNSATGEEVSKNPVDTIDLQDNHTLIANFLYGETELLLSANPAEGGTVAGSGHYHCDEFAVFIAEANECYKFLNWTDASSGEVVSFEQIDSLLMNKDNKLIANFERASLFNLTTQASPIEGGMTEEVYFGCSTAVYTAVESDCYAFINWTDANSGAIISTKLTDTIDLFEDRILVANFEYYDYVLNLSSSLHLKGNQLSADYKYNLGDDNIKLRVAMNSDVSPSELSKITELNISFDYSNVFASVKPSSLKLLDLSNDWTITNPSNSNDFERLISNYTVTLSNPLGLSSSSINLLEIEFQMALPNSEMLQEKINDDHYRLFILPALSIRGTNCITIKADTSRLTINPICAIDFRILKISDTEFSLNIEDNVINYSVGFDCEASLTIYNSLGQAILVPVSGLINKGHYTFDLNNIDFPSGSYFCELIIDGLYRKIVGTIVGK